MQYNTEMKQFYTRPFFSFDDGIKVKMLLKISAFKID